MNTDKIYAEQLANEYALKDTSKVIALRRFYLYLRHYHCAGSRCWNVPFHEGHRQR